MSAPRLLFASCHGYIDPSSGAALATRDVLELLVERGWDCRVLSTGVLDFEVETPLGELLSQMQIPFTEARALIGAGTERPVLDSEVGGVRVTLLPTASSRAEKAPNLEESRHFLDLADEIFVRFRPNVLLTYGGHPANLELMRRARSRGTAVVFHLHNFGYPDDQAFVDATAVLVPSEYARRVYRDALGLDCTAIPYPLNHERVVARDAAPRYLTFVNPQPAKGVSVFARIAAELDARRPDIPVLVVEGRGSADGLANAGLDLSGLKNLHRMANTPDPRDFYQVTRVLLVPSLWRESFGRVAAEGLLNGLPVLASDRGALPETLGDAGFLFSIPSQCTAISGVVPTARDVAPWIATVERLWDDPNWELRHRQIARDSARRWDYESLARAYESFFSNFLQ